MRILLTGAALFNFFLISPAGAAQAGKQSIRVERRSALDKPTLEAYIRHLNVWGPQISVRIADPKPGPMPGYLEVQVTASANKASVTETYYVSKDGQKIVRGFVYDINENPFKADLQKLNTESQPSFGTPGAPVALVLFTDYQCPYCREEAKMLRQNLSGEYAQKVRFYLKEFPLDQIHSWAKPAAVAGRCIFHMNPNVFWDYHDWIFENQSAITVENLKAKVMEFAAGKKLDTLQLGRCIDTRATESEIDKNIREAAVLGVNSTPTLFVNGRKIPAQLPWPNLKAVIDFEVDYQKTAQNAGDAACCEVKVPSPLQR